MKTKFSLITGLFVIYFFGSSVFAFAFEGCTFFNGKRFSSQTSDRDAGFLQNKLTVPSKITLITPSDNKDSPSTFQVELPSLNKAEFLNAQRLATLVKERDELEYQQFLLQPYDSTEKNNQIEQISSRLEEISREINQTSAILVEKSRALNCRCYSKSKYSFGSDLNPYFLFSEDANLYECTMISQT